MIWKAIIIGSLAITVFNLTGMTIGLATNYKFCSPPRPKVWVLLYIFFILTSLVILEVIK